MSSDPLGGAPLPTPLVRVSEQELPQGVREVLERRCLTCHTYGSRDPSGWGSALDLSRMIASGIVVPGDPDNSRLWHRIAVRADMPYNGERLSGTEVGLMRAWIANLERPMPEAPRSPRALLDLIATDVAGAGQQRQSDTRYIGFAHFEDERRSPEEKLAAEQALSLALNSLSRRSAIVPLEAVDAERTIFRFRISALGWSNSDWDLLASFYPYCLGSDEARHQTAYRRLGTEVPYLRGDWFVATATKAPLYHRLLRLPDNLDELGRQLGVNINDDLNHPGQARPSRVQRIGFRSSGVSSFNRIIDRHQPNNGGSLWISYDFASNINRSDIRANPLGPENRSNRGFEHTFIPAGGEVIFTLPNGLYGYLLVDGEGRRIDAAPTTIVRDLRRPAGAVENGISCFGCHGVTGMNLPRAFDDIVRYADEHRNDFSRAELDEIRALYPTTGSDILNRDAAAYLTARDGLGGERVPAGVVEYDDFINLVGSYEARLGLRGAAIELGITEAAARTLVSSGSNEDLLPLSLADPLLPRQDFVCRFRSLATRAARNTRFCAGTFNAPEVRDLCQ